MCFAAAFPLLFLPLQDPPEVVRIDGLSHAASADNATETPPDLSPPSLLHHSASNTSFIAGGLVCTRLEAPSTDGTAMVPVTVFHRLMQR